MISINGFIRRLSGDLIVFEDSSAWRAHGTSAEFSHWSPLDPVEITGPYAAARMTNMRTEETIVVAGMKEVRDQGKAAAS